MLLAPPVELRYADVRVIGGVQLQLPSAHRNCLIYSLNVSFGGD